MKIAVKEHPLGMNAILRKKDQLKKCPSRMS
jgi:hypothetical protein